jgi:hypothetical protein
LLSIAASHFGSIVFQVDFSNKPKTGQERPIMLPALPFVVSDLGAHAA